MKYPCDLTPIVAIDRRVGLSLSQGRGQGVGFCSWLMRVTVFQVNDLAGVMNKLNRPVQGLGEISEGTYPPTLPKWEEGLSVDGVGEFPSQCFV